MANSVSVRRHRAVRYLEDTIEQKRIAAFVVVEQLHVSEIGDRGRYVGMQVRPAVGRHLEVVAAAMAATSMSS